MSRYITSTLKLLIKCLSGCTECFSHFTKIAENLIRLCRSLIF